MRLSKDLTLKPAGIVIEDTNKWFAMIQATAEAGHHFDSV